MMDIKDAMAFSQEETGYALKIASKIVQERIKEMDENPEEFEKFARFWLNYRKTRGSMTEDEFRILMADAGYEYVKENNK